MVWKISRQHHFHNNIWKDYREPVVKKPIAKTSLGEVLYSEIYSIASSNATSCCGALMKWEHTLLYMGRFYVAVVGNVSA